jgi:hypothetical protein
LFSICGLFVALDAVDSYDYRNPTVTEMRCVMLRVCLVFLLMECLVARANAVMAGDEIPLRFAPASRIVAIGDLHGDLNAARQALRLAGVVDENDHWVGGTLVMVQTGDLLDRGDNEQAVLDLFTRLVEEASQAGGAIHVLNGNHELMNVQLDFRYVTSGGFKDFQDAVTITDIDSVLAEYEEGQRARVSAFRPGGTYAKVLARRNTVVIIGQNIFVHGGVLPEHVDYGLEKLNAELRAWMGGEGPIPKWTQEKDSPVWMRHYSLEVDGEDCDLLAEVLDRLGVKRMIVGHSVHTETITSYCDGKVWCIDVGMAAYYGGEVRILAIEGDTIRVISKK